MSKAALMRLCVLLALVAAPILLMGDIIDPK
jgi:hypothetical protein